MTAREAQRIATNWRTPIGWKRCLCHVAKADKWWKKSNHYIGKSGIGSRQGAMEAFRECAKRLPVDKINGPICLVFGPDTHRQMLAFMDGRHRFAVIRDAGAKMCVINTDSAGERLMRKCGLLVEKKKVR